MAAVEGNAAREHMLFIGSKIGMAMDQDTPSGESPATCNTREGWFSWVTGTYGGLNLVGRALGAVLQDLGRSASVGYDEVINN